ncbi:MAG: hypothetical protein PHH06_05275 [Candidatus Gracilibacteria bacterium]|nr:hypothetical protein [Candidatus Gracilibacteria bacterium]
MTSEITPPGKNARMTKAQVKKYVADMKQAQAIAQEKIKQAQNSGEMKQEEKEIEQLENLLDEEINK